jgi:DNA-binding NarL/FixJ family response regulator
MNATPVTRVLIVDDHELFRRGVCNTIESDGDLQVVGEAANGNEALVKAMDLDPDLILLDISMPGPSGTDVIRRIKDKRPQVKVIMLTVRDDKASLLEAVKSGADGFLSKDIRGQALRTNLQGAVRGEAAISRHMFAWVVEELARLGQLETGQIHCQLTHREKQVLAKIYEGLGNQEISDALCISVNTVKTHIGHIYEKLHIHSRSEAAAYAWRMGETVSPKAMQTRSV